jgi:hypothetical protein
METNRLAVDRKATINFQCVKTSGTLKVDNNECCFLCPGRDRMLFYISSDADVQWI